MTFAYLLSVCKIIPYFFRVPRGCYALRVTGATPGRGGLPLTPRPRGTIYEALPLIHADSLSSCGFRQRDGNGEVSV
jgi:hypothetical protein